MSPTSQLETPPARAGASARRGAGATRVALAGAGYIADTHLAILRELPGVELVAIADPALERARSAARRFGVPHAVASLDELAPLRIDVVHLLVPPDRHAAVARECLERGMSVFVEKPLAPSAREARELGELARARGLVLGVNHNSLFHPAFTRLLARLRQGAIGRIEHVQVTLSVPLRQLDAQDFSHWMFREPRNIVFEQAPHPFAQLAELVGRPLEVHPRVLATRALPGLDFPERWCIAARGERASAEVYFAFGASFPRSSISVLGSDGALEADLQHGLSAEERKTPWLDFWNSYLAGARRAASLRRGARGNLLAYLRQTLRLGAREDPFYAGMRGSIRAFHAAFRDGREPPVGAAEAEVVLAWCEATAGALAAPAPRAPLAPSARPARAGEVVVLGAGGFIGRHLLSALRARELPATAVVRRLHGLSEEIETSARTGSLRLARADLTDPEALRAALRGARAVVHLATGGGASWEEVERAMVAGTRALGELCLAEKVERLIYVSSIAALYLGPDCGTELVEDDFPTDPRPEQRALYARGKALAERELVRLSREQGLPVTIVRPGVVLGRGTPLQHSGLGLWVRDNHCVGWGRGNRPLPLVLVEDVADALARLAAHAGKELDGKTLNLAARVPWTAAELVLALRRATGRDLHFHPRPLALSQAMEIGKWLVKKAGGRRDAFPSYRDLKSRSLHPPFSARTAREVLGWRPCEEREELLKRMLPETSA